MAIAIIFRCIHFNYRCRLEQSVIFIVSLMGQYCFAFWRLSSVVVCNAVSWRADRPPGRPPGAWAVGRPILHGEPVRLCPVRATPCLWRIAITFYRLLRSDFDVFQMLHRWSKISFYQRSTPPRQISPLSMQGRGREPQKLKIIRNFKI